MTVKSTLPVITGERLDLRPLMSADLPMTLSWRNQDAIRSWFFHSEIITLDQHQAWFESYQRKEDDFVFVIEEKVALKRPVGQVALYNIDWENRRGEFGRLMIGDSQARGLGLAKEATWMLVRFAEADLGLQEIYLEVYAANAPALAVYRACRFSVIKSRDGVIAMTRRHTKPEY